MGNCQAAEAATVVIQHPAAENGKGKVERYYYSITANQVMGSNPGYYVALVLQNPARPDGPPLKNQLKLLRPDDTLHIDHVYRLISFEDVLKEFTAKKSVKLGKLLKESGVIGVDKTNGGSHSQLDYYKMEGASHRPGMVNTYNGGGRGVGIGRHLVLGRGQWKPALQSIAEFPPS